MDAQSPILANPALPRRRGHWPPVWAAIFCFAAIVATVGAITGGPEREGIFLPALCLGVMALAAGFDAATSRIPNPITYPAILIGLGANGLAILLHHTAPHVAARWLGAAGPAQSVLGLLLFGGIGFVGVVFAGMGGGDMKLLGAIGAILGLSRASDVVLCGGAAAVVYAIVNLLIAGRLNATCRAAAVQFLNLLYLRESSVAVSRAEPSRRTIPLALPLLAGLILSKVPVIGGITAWLTKSG